MRAGLFCTAFGLAATSLLCAYDAHAGGGEVQIQSNQGVFDLNFNAYGFVSGFSAANHQTLENELTAANQTLCDMTEGQFRIGNVDIYETRMRTWGDDVQVWPDNSSFGPTTSACGDPGIQRPGLSQVDAYLRRGSFCVFFLDQISVDVPGFTTAHEMGHYGFELLDEYPIPDRTDCTGSPTDLSSGTCDASPTCVMQSRGGSQLCVAQNHDSVQQCTPPPNGVFETTAQQLYHGRSCFEHLASTWSFVSQPAGLPSTTPPLPSVCDSPTIRDRTGWPDSLAFVLDVSCSMNLSSQAGVDEVCNNMLDDDFDGVIDEADCAASRLDMLKDAAVAQMNMLAQWEPDFLTVTFSQQAQLAVSRQTLSASNLTTLEGQIRGLTAQTTTAIGRGLEMAQTELNQVPDSVKTVLLFTDGLNNVVPPDPIAQVVSMATDEIMVDPIHLGPTGGQFRFDISRNTYLGLPPMEEDDGYLLPTTFARHFALRQGYTFTADTVGFRTDTPQNDPSVLQFLTRTPVSYFESLLSQPDNVDVFGPAAITWEYVFHVPPGAADLKALVSDADGPSASFGVETALVSPSGARFEVGQPGGPLRVHRAGHFDLLQLAAPEAGRWTAEISTAAGAPPRQQGYLTILEDVPGTRLSVDAAPDVAPPSTRREVRIRARFGGALLNEVAVLRVRVVAPDGTSQEFPVTPMGTEFHATVQGSSTDGLHVVEALIETGSTSTALQGEKIFADQVGIPYSGTIIVPELELVGRTTFLQATGAGVPGGDG